MAILQKWNINSLAKAVEPGIETLIGSELQKMIDSAVSEAEREIRAELTKKCALKLKSSLEKSLVGGDILEIHVDLTLGK